MVRVAVSPYTTGSSSLGRTFVPACRGSDVFWHIYLTFKELERGTVISQEIGSKNNLVEKVPHIVLAPACAALDAKDCRDPAEKPRTSY